MCILIKILVITYVPVSDFHVVLETRHFIACVSIMFSVCPYSFIHFHVRQFHKYRSRHPTHTAFCGVPITMIGILKLYILFMVSMTTICIFCVYYVLSLTAISFGFAYTTTYNFYTLGYVLCI